MSLNRRLIDLMKYKADCISKYSDVKYFTDEDEAEINSWEEEHCQKIIVNILQSLEEKGEVDDAAICPFCEDIHILDTECEDCGYGKRHRMCSDGDDEDEVLSDYENITDKLIEEGAYRISRITCFDVMRLILNGGNYVQV